MRNVRNKNEIVKNIVIILLVLNLGFLTWRSGLFRIQTGMSSPFAWLTSLISSDKKEPVETAEVNAEAARPMTVIITDSHGDHSGARYNTEERNSIYERTDRIFGEAFGSAGEMEIISEDMWKEALTSVGIYYEYMSDVPLEMLCGWFGTEPGGFADEATRRLCLYDNGEEIYLAWQRGENSYARASTYVNRNGLLAQTANTADSQYLFAFEEDEYHVVEDKFLAILINQVQHPVFEISKPLQDDAALESVLRAFGVNTKLTTGYTEGGTLVYVESDKTLRISDSGRLTCRWITTDGSAIPELAGAVETVRRIAENSVSPICGEADVYFDSAKYNEDGTVEVVFYYTLAGGRVYVHEDGFAINAVVSSAGLREITINFRTYSRSDELTNLIPELQAAAAAQGRFTFAYREVGNRRAEPQWIKD